MARSEYPIEAMRTVSLIGTYGNDCFESIDYGAKVGSKVI